MEYQLQFEQISKKQTISEPRRLGLVVVGLSVSHQSEDFAKYQLVSQSGIQFDEFRMIYVMNRR